MFFAIRFGALLTPRQEVSRKSITHEVEETFHIILLTEVAGTVKHGGFYFNRTCASSNKLSQESEIIELITAECSELDGN